MSVIGHNNKPHVSVNSLSAEDKKYLKGVVTELNDSLTRIAAERELQKETLGKVVDRLGVDKKLVKRMAKAYFNANFNKEVEEHNEFEDFYNMIMNGDKT